MRKSGTIVSYTIEEIDEMLARGESQTDWAAADAMTEEELETAIASDPDEAGWEYDLSLAFPGLPSIPERKQQITLRIDEDVLDWFKATGKGYQTRINAVRRRYMGMQEVERRKRERAGTATGE